MQIMHSFMPCTVHVHTPDCSRIAQRFSYADPVAFVDVVGFHQQVYQDSPASIPR